MKPEIEQMKIARDRDGLLKALDEPEAKIRFQAAQALGELRDVDGLCKVLAYEWYRPEAAVLLGEIGDRSAVRHLLSYIDGSDNLTKDRIVRALGRLGGSEAVQALRRMLKDDDPAIYSTVVTTLFGMDDPEAQQALITGMQNQQLAIESREAVPSSSDKEWAEQEKMNSLRGLPGQDVAEPDAHAELVRLLRSDDYNERVEAIEKLGDRGDPRAIDPLIELFGDEYISVQYEAALAVARLGPNAFDPLCRALVADDYKVRTTAASALGCLGDLRGVNPLETMLRVEHSKWAQDHAQAALERLRIWGEVERVRGAEHRELPPLVESSGRESPDANADVRFSNQTGLDVTIWIVGLRRCSEVKLAADKKLNYSFTTGTYDIAGVADAGAASPRLLRDQRLDAGLEYQLEWPEDPA